MKKRGKRNKTITENCNIYEICFGKSYSKLDAMSALKSFND